MNDSYKVIVIGAGPSGLTSAKYLSQSGITDLLVLEKQKGVGGLWNPEEGHIWNNLITNVSKYTCAFSDFPWPEDTPMFPKGRSLYQYMKNYSDHFGVTNYIQFGSKVTSVVRNEDQTFKVKWSRHNDGEKTIHEADCEHLIIGSGIFGYPNMELNIPGLEEFEGEKIHSSQYKDPESFKGKRVLVVGGSISGV